MSCAAKNKKRKRPGRGQLRRPRRENWKGRIKKWKMPHRRSRTTRPTMTGTMLMMTTVVKGPSARGPIRDHVRTHREKSGAIEQDRGEEGLLDMPPRHHQRLRRRRRPTLQLLMPLPQGVAKMASKGTKSSNSSKVTAVTAGVATMQPIKNKKGLHLRHQNFTCTPP